MNVSLPDEIEQRFTADELRLHLAMGLFQAERVTLGQGAAIAAVSQSEFLHELGRRRIAIHYDEADLMADVAAVPFLLSLGPRHNGQQLTVPGQ